MAQPGNFTPILLYGSSTPTNVPLAANLTNSATGSEIAINVADKNLFFKDSGGTVNTVPIRQSSTSSNGWLSSTDWNTFNGKAPATSGTSILYGNGTGGFSNVTIGSGISFAGGTLSATGTGGTVTSVAALTIGTTGTDLSSTVANGTTTPVITLNVPTASAANRGALSAADWSTFNSKQAALVSGTNIKTVGGVTLLGSGDVGTIGVGYGGTGTSTAFTAGSIVFAGASGVYSQKNANLFWDNTNNRLGVNISTPAAALDVSTTAGRYFFSFSGSDNKISCVNNANNAYINLILNGSNLLFQTSDTERARIISSGEFLVGTTSATPGYGNTNTGQQLGGASISTFSRSAADYVMSVNQNTADGLNYYQMVFRVSNVTKGSISSTSTATVYATTSDYRLKENVAPMTDALSVVSKLKPVTYTWKEDGSDGQGFIAHELAEVMPGCVTSKKDAVDAKGNPIYQGIDTSFLAATLASAIQELNAKFDAYVASHP